VRAAAGQAQPAATLPGAADATATAANTSEAGWPAKECLKMDKGPAGRRHTLVGLDGVHNWLLGGYDKPAAATGNSPAVDFDWTPNVERDIKGYKVYWVGPDHAIGGGDDAQVAAFRYGTLLQVMERRGVDSDV